MARSKGPSRAFREDIMRGERSVGPKPKRADATPGGLGGSNPETNVYLAKRPQGAPGTAGSAEGAGASIFDPVLCELAYRWFCPPVGAVLDPFAGGSVRGIVAGKLGRRYTGIDLSERQLVANRAQAVSICAAPDVMPAWLVGDAVDLDQVLKLEPVFDFLFSCPPYADLERYSSDPRDLSTMDWVHFREAYGRAIAKACACLKPDRFAVWVVGDARGKDGFLYGLPAYTVQAFEAAGLRLYNDAVLVTAVGSLPARTRKQFQGSRKLGRTHQMVYVFCKGDPKKATAAVGPVEFGSGEADVTQDAEVISTTEQQLAQAIAAPQAAESGALIGTRWKVSAAWLSRNHDCTAAGIALRCHGGCCRSTSFWPPVTGEPGHDGVRACPQLGPAGCRFSQADKPVTCLLYPLRLNANGTLVLHNRTTTAAGVCQGNHGNGPPLIDAMAPSLVELFGQAAYDRVRTDVLAGRDSWFDVPPAVQVAMAHEREWEADRVPPQQRSMWGEVTAPAGAGRSLEQVRVETPPARAAAPSTEQTPIVRLGSIWVKRDDMFTRAGVDGGKVRTCWHLAHQAFDAGKEGLVTAGSRASPQVNIVAHIAQALGMPCRAHVPASAAPMPAELVSAQRAGAEIVYHRPGHNSVIIARARDDAAARGWAEIPFGMECEEAVRQTASQVYDFPVGTKRVVVPVGSGMSLAGILHGMVDAGWLGEPAVLGVVVGADPTKRLDKYAPPDWRDMVQLVPSGSDYHDPAPVTVWEGLQLDPIYEAKCIPFLQPDDLLWVVGIRQKLPR